MPMSALLTTTMANMAEVIEVITEAGLRKKVKIMISEAPITDEYTRKIGADGYARMPASQPNCHFHSLNNPCRK